MHFLSIIIPTYNSQNTIKSTIDSILSQTYNNYEILIIDGISTDDTLQIVESYQDSRIKISSEKDSGVYDAMNKGIIASSGDWLYFLGSDDSLYDKYVLENVFKEIERLNSDVTYGDAYFTHKKYLHHGEFTREKICNKTNICHQAIFYKKEVFERLGNYNLDFIIYADWDFNIRCFLTPDLKINYIKQVIANYNDAYGLSNSGTRDRNFEKLEYKYIMDKFEVVSFLKSENKQLLHSPEYRIGKAILSPFRVIISLFRK